MSRELMLSFYQNPLRSLVQEVRLALASNVGINQLLLVGSFASSKVLRERIISEFHGKGGVSVVAPDVQPKPQGAVVEGAVLFGQYNYIVKTAAMCTQQDRAALKTFDQLAFLTACLNDVMLTQAARERTLQMLVSKQKECPSLFWFYPKRRELRNWLSNPTKCLFQDTLMLVVVCPVTLCVVPCGPDSVGWELSVPKKWVQKWGPAIMVSIYVMQAAVLAGRVVGIPLPQLPSAAAITGLSSTVIGTTVDKLANQESIIESLTGLASTVAAVMDHAPEMQALAVSVQQGKGVQQNVAKAVPKQLLDDSYRSIHTFLTTGDNAQLGKLEDQLRGKMERLMAENGDVDWVSVEGREIWLAARKLTKENNFPSDGCGAGSNGEPPCAGTMSASTSEDRIAIRELQATVKQLQATVENLTLRIDQLQRQQGSAHSTLPAVAPAAQETKKKKSFLSFGTK